MYDRIVDGVACMVMRGGTSKGLFFLASDLPEEPKDRDTFLLSAMGSPDDRQIDGLGGAHPLTSKVAIVSRSTDSDGGVNSGGAIADVDYLFLQVAVDRAAVSDAQNCGNMLAAVGPFAVERGLVTVPNDGQACVRIRMLNTGGVAVSRFPVRDGRPVYAGKTAIAGVPGTGAEVRIDFADTAGSSCGSLLPTGNVVDVIEGVRVTLIDNGMPVVVMKASDVGATGYEDPAVLEANTELRSLIEKIRLGAGPMMGLGDVAQSTVPKLTLVAAPREGGALSTRTFIPHRCHDAIGVLGAVSVATAALLDGSPAAEVAVLSGSGAIVVEHPTGTFDAAIDFEIRDGKLELRRAGIIRTARKLMDGRIFEREPLAGDL